VSKFGFGSWCTRASKQLSFASGSARPEHRNICTIKKYKKLCYCRLTALCAMSVKIWSTVETSCTTNPQQIAVMELKGYSWPICSEQPRLVDCRIGVANKPQRRRWWVLLTTWWTCGGENFSSKSGVWNSPTGKYFLEIPKFPYNTVWDREKEAHAKISWIRPVVSIQYQLVTDGQTDRQTNPQTHDDSKYRTVIV